MKTECRAHAHSVWVHRIATVREKQMSSGEGDCGPEGVIGSCTDCLDTKPLAYSYNPIQRWRMLYSVDDALGHGTLFEELDKPVGVYGNE